jgi:hypothetical protein
LFEFELKRRLDLRDLISSCCIDIWSGRRGLNPRPSRWQRDVLPLNYSRMITIQNLHRRNFRVGNSSHPPVGSFEAGCLASGRRWRPFPPTRRRFGQLRFPLTICWGRESNPHTFRYTPLKRARLPVPPPQHYTVLLLSRRRHRGHGVLAGYRS